MYNSPEFPDIENVLEEESFIPDKCKDCPALKTMEACRQEAEEMLLGTTEVGALAMSADTEELKKQARAIFGLTEEEAEEGLAQATGSIGEELDRIDYMIGWLRKGVESLPSCCSGPIEMQEERDGLVHRVRLCSSKLASVAEEELGILVEKTTEPKRKTK